MESLFRHIQEALSKGQGGALATIVKRRGSVPRKEGAHFFLTSAGDLHGTIGGGGLEAEVLKLARTSLETDTGFLRAFTLVEGDDPSDMVCGGNVKVLVEPFSPEQDATFDLITKSLARHAACCFFRLFRADPAATPRVNPGPLGVIQAGEKHFLSASVDPVLEKRLFAWGEVLLKEGTPGIRVLGPETLEFPATEPWNLIVFEIIQSYPRLVIFGGGHLSKALCAMANLCRFLVEVIDDREEFANKARFPKAARAFHLPGYRNISELITLDAHTYVVIATRGHRFDEIVLAQVVGHELPYIGMVGSRQKNRIVFDRLRERGISPARLENVHAPIGLSINSETPEEIAVSILAELIATRNRRENKG